MYYHQTNQIDEPLKLTDKHKNIVWQAQQHGFVLKVSQADIEQPLRFPGQLEDNRRAFTTTSIVIITPVLGGVSPVTRLD